VLLAGGAAAAGVGVYAGVQALSARKEAQDGCASDGARVCWASAKDALDRDKRF